MATISITSGLTDNQTSNMLGYIGDFNILKTKILYDATSLTADTFGDFRQYSNATTKTLNYCTVANSTKGAGTWITAETAQISGTLTIIAAGGMAGHFYDSATGEQGYCIYVNANEAISKGNVVTPLQGGTAMRFVKVPITGNNNDTPSGVALTVANGVGSGFWMAVSGIVRVLPETDVTPTLGYIIYTSAATAGCVAQSATAPADANHFKEVGHWMETVAINTIAKAIIHFN